MFIIQSVSTKDYPALKKLAKKYALLNLPSSPSLLKKKIEQSEKSFSETLPPKNRNFLFVLKTQEGELIGSSQVSAQSATKSAPSYSLKIFHPPSPLRRQKSKLKKTPFLKLKIITDGPSYLGGLVLEKKYRGHPLKAGKQISLIRFLWAGMRPQVFKDVFHAEVAPFLNKQGKNPFFEEFIFPRIGLSMKEIDYLTLTDKEKLFSSYPKEKLFLSDLPLSVRKTLGKPGPLSQKAEGLLRQQNFSFAKEVDPFDGGPYLQAKKEHIPLIQHTKKVFLENFSLRRATPLAQSFKSQPEEIKNWLWGKLKNGQFLGGLMEGFLNESELKVSKDFLKGFSLEEGEEVFISPF